jgi:hypothetical protein
VQVEITPEPAPEQRELLLRALALVNGLGTAPDAWWQAGSREATEDEQDEG